MTNDLITTTNTPQGLEQSSPSIMHQAGQAANQAAAHNIFESHRAGKSMYTLARYDSDLAVFGDFLRSIGVPAGDLAHDPAAWSGVTWGLLEAYKAWMLQEGYAVSSVNIRLITARTHACLAVEAGACTEDIAKLKYVKGYRHNEVPHVDEKRTSAGIETRRSLRRDGAAATKKAESTRIGTDQANLLKSQPDTPRGHRDQLLMCLLLDHGLRAGEVSILTVEAFDLEHETFTFKRPKVDKRQTHKLTPDTLAALRTYLKNDAPPSGNLWRQSRKGKAGVLVPGKRGMSTRGITKRVKDLGEVVGIARLSAHDCRHYWASQAARSDTPLDRLVQAGGWKSKDMALRYIEEHEIANEGVKLE